MRLNYHHLQYFYAIATHGSIAKASLALHITPQTLSSQLQKLEEQLGYTLFDRIGKKMHLNAMGNVTYSYAKEIFDLGDELLNSLQNHSEQFAFKFAIGVTDVIAKVFSFNFLKQIYTMDDSIKLICKETSLDTLLRELAINKLDAVLSDTSLPAYTAVKAFNHFVGKSGMSFFSTPKEAQYLKQTFPQSLDGAPFFLAGEGSNQRINVLSWFERIGVQPKIIGEFDDSVLTKYFCQANYGICCAPTIIEQHVINQFDLSVIGRTDQIMEHYYLISPERKVKHPAVQHLLTESRKLFQAPLN
jgi:LysR family transcriptional activator of nhaA